ncbi:hypothetical protein KL910_001303 [Ogataea haglerorum]|nr:hypothetical protein KL945_003346 [Ogataea haglerorum]KAG7791922.1 hypothetical protein KL910_001303 [Ogataea haglerorum]
MSEIEYEPLCLDVDTLGRETIDAHIEQIRRLVDQHLSEPYSIYVYRFFLNNWPNLTLMAKHQGRVIGCIISKVEPHKNARIQRGLDDRRLPLRRDHPGDRGGQQGRAAAVRELRVSACETAVPLLSEQARRVPADPARDREQQHAVDVSAAAGERAGVHILTIELAI